MTYYSTNTIESTDKVEFIPYSLKVRRSKSWEKRKLLVHSNDNMNKLIPAAEQENKGQCVYLRQNCLKQN